MDDLKLVAYMAGYLNKEAKGQGTPLQRKRTGAVPGNTATSTGKAYNAVSPNNGSIPQQIGNTTKSMLKGIGGELSKGANRVKGMFTSTNRTDGTTNSTAVPAAPPLTTKNNGQASQWTMTNTWSSSGNRNPATAFGQPPILSSSSPNQFAQSPFTMQSNPGGQLRANAEMKQQVPVNSAVVSATAGKPTTSTTANDTVDQRISTQSSIASAEQNPARSATGLTEAVNRSTLPNQNRFM